MKTGFFRLMQLATLAWAAVISPALRLQVFGQVNARVDRYAITSAPSYVFERGELEILTYETEQAYDKLQTLFEERWKADSKMRKHGNAS